MVRITGPGRDGVGEIEVRTPAAFSGYLGRPDATRAAFTADGWLRTGDLGRLDSSDCLFVADRRDDLVISGGENVYPAEVEAVLASHPAIEDAGVAGRADPRWGAVPVAGIVLRRGVREPDDQALESLRTFGHTVEYRKDAIGNVQLLVIRSGLIHAARGAVSQSKP
jgi:O-succinylbenzoic acid--CoA ligase